MLPGLADVLEFRQVDGAWMSESGATVEIGASMAAERPDAEQAGGMARRRLGSVTGQLSHARAN